VLVNVQLFAVARQVAGTSSILLELPETANVADVRRALGDAVPSLAALLPKMMIAVDSEYSEDNRSIVPGSEVAVIPPVSGGSDG
jgi:molybdopterin converting factor subunit 1